MEEQSADAVTTYFTEFLPGKLHQPLLPNLQKLSAAFQIILSGQNEMRWTLTIHEGLLVSIALCVDTSVHVSTHSRDASPAACGFRLERRVFAEIIAGRLSPQMAFFKRKVEIEGDMALGLRLATVLAEFFKRFPYPADGRA